LIGWIIRLGWDSDTDVGLQGYGRDFYWVVEWVDEDSGLIEGLKAAEGS
jgi:hypothetical protein